MQWFKIYGEKWFSGSTRWELTVEQRGVWVDLLARASINDPRGQINYYSSEQLAQQFNIKLELLENTIKRCEEAKKIKHFQKKREIVIINWKKYQSEYERQKPYRKQDRCQSKVTKMDDKSCNKVTLRKEGEERRLEIEENKIRGEEKIKEILPPDIYPSNSPSPSNPSTKEQLTIKDEFLKKFYGLVDLLIEKMQENDPKAKVPKTEKQRDNWANEFRLLVKRDGRGIEEVKEVLVWSQDDSFWKGNILSAAKFREQYPKLRLKMESQNDGSIRESSQKEKPQLDVGSKQPFTEGDEKYLPQIEKEYEELKRAYMQKYDITDEEDIDYFGPRAFGTLTDYKSKRLPELKRQDSKLDGKD